ncbi:hypothetical protein TBLA_0B01440 [Henningerozyma blattae CBS 6284]|uniref:Glycosyltransferase family 15 protein n=1 Tax=Henningerozyma blattae (strain ATCC 34711 / CBS 6284 / DSM 70876 / NBRC 10599 / NRRL Y-10934 / UCD 77-7) TaxID=1071380 RepID=I2GXY5_HENB6|nr:hypothetical protein TBLA_0B01440 [Tetrapisispora blattae CBS 6284]CCH58987.1 hypothetical protein TBLA_0B01440 [Tetrapisispora blattae CBS 6284]
MSKKGSLKTTKRTRLYKQLGVALITLIGLYSLFHHSSKNVSLSTYTTIGSPDYLEPLKYAPSSTALPTDLPVDHNKYTRLLPFKYNGKKEKATFVTLARNSDLYGLINSIKAVEDRFNSKFQYDWVFLNDEEFSDEFKKTVTALISGETKFGLIPNEHWSYPSWIDKKRAADTRKTMKEKNIIYGDSESYRHMCRYESGFFWRHPLLDEYEYYWRVEPDIKMYCDIDYDVFKFMKDNKKKYGFTITIHEFRDTIETLWETTREFLSLYPQHIHKNNMLDFVSDDNGKTYNLCHFWSNFEIASLKFLRSQAYRDYFDYLDHAGGFFYERWGDAPVHSIAASLFLDRDEIHHFEGMGYYHGPYHQCPINDQIRLHNKCACNPNDDFTWKDYSCTLKYYDINNITKPDGWKDHTG